jgi:hypothetical protein
MLLPPTDFARRVGNDLASMKLALLPSTVTALLRVASAGTVSVKGGATGAD